MGKEIVLISQYTTKFEKLIIILMMAINSVILLRLIFNFTLSLSTFFLFFTILIAIIILKKLKQIYPKRKIFKIYLNIILGFSFIWLSSFLYIEYKVIEGYKYNYLNNKYDTLLILGSGLKNGDKISSTLKSRLDKALKVYSSNPNAIIITSGGKGNDEILSESLAMKKYLIKYGIPSKKIFLEDKSTSTYENILFSKRVLKLNNKVIKNIAIITSDYHSYRAGLFAKVNKIKVSTISSRTPNFPRFFSSIREYYAVIANYVFY